MRVNLDRIDVKVKETTDDQKMAIFYDADKISEKEVMDFVDKYPTEILDGYSSNENLIVMKSEMADRLMNMLNLN